VLNYKIQYNYIPGQIFSIYHSLKNEKKITPYWKNMDDNELWNHLVFCILSSNVPYELALSSTLHLMENNLLDVSWLSNTEKGYLRISHELSRPIFKPKKRNGDFRKYRFPLIRSRNIHNASKIIKNGFTKLLDDKKTDFEIRNNIAKCISGIGLKQSSLFLRNIGFSNNLAIIDTHIIAFLNKILEPPLKKSLITSEKQYFKIEEILVNITKNLNLDLSLFDLALWEYMRRRGSFENSCIIFGRD